MKLQALVTIAFIFSIQFLFAQPADLDPGKWAVELTKKDPGVYDSLNSLKSKLQQADTGKAFQFLDELSERGKSKGDHFKALFNIGDKYRSGSYAVRVIQGRRIKQLTLIKIAD